MRKSHQSINNVFFGFLVVGFFCAAAQSQQAASPAEPSKKAAILPGSFIVASLPQPSDAAATRPESAAPSENVITLATPPLQGQSTTTTSQGSSPSPFASSDDELHDNKWHYYGTVYLWVPSMHGTVGVAGYDTSLHVTTGDILSNFRGGFLGVFTPTYNRFSAPVDVLWMRLRSSKPVPYVPVDGSDTGYSVRATLNESIITPKVNYLAVDNPKLKVYGTAGARVWHVGTTLSLVPVLNGTFPYKGLTWTDFVLGARFNVPLGTKASVDILGDGGEGGATLDYQIGGIVNLQLKPKLTAQVGWRYLTEHYGNNGNILNTTTQGVVFGATYKFK
jgi:hypothetical protein